MAFNNSWMQLLLAVVVAALAVISPAQALVQPQPQPQPQPSKGGSRSSNAPSTSTAPTTSSTSNANSRRDFLNRIATTTAAAAAIAIAGAASTSSPLWVPSSASAATAEAGARAADSSLVLPSTTNEPLLVASSKLKLPPMGLGCWAWGDSLFWGYNPKNDADLAEVFDYAVNIRDPKSPVLLDTAELYGFGRSESLVGEYSKNLANQQSKDEIVVATKFAALPFRTTAESVVKACKASVQRLGGRPIDLYQIHFPGAWANAAYWDGMAQCYEQGLIKAVGVSNYGVDATIACHTALAKRGIPLATNQIQYNLLYQFPKENGLLQACEDLGIQVLAYSPMALGLLTGKYTTKESLQSMQGAPRKGLFAKTVETPAFQNLLGVMGKVAAAHTTTTTGTGTGTSTAANIPQVAINWCRAKGTIPIPGARNLRQVQSNYAALEWELSEDEIRLLDEASANLSYIRPEASPMAQYDKELQLNMFDS
jgi:pyridoxine 4-dehydrogenase